MLSDEEWKAMKLLNDMIKHKPDTIRLEWRKGIYALQLVLNLIEKQSKEIEELKDKNKKLQDKAKELIFEKQELTSGLLDSTPNDKIKAKIEEVDKQEKEELKGTKGQDRYDIKLEYQYKRNILQELLEE